MTFHFLLSKLDLGEQNQRPYPSVAMNGAKNVGLLAVQILSVADGALRHKLLDYKQGLSDSVMEKVQRLAGLRDATLD